MEEIFPFASEPNKQNHIGDEPQIVTPTDNACPHLSVDVPSDNIPYDDSYRENELSYDISNELVHDFILFENLVGDSSLPLISNEEVSAQPLAPSATNEKRVKRPPIWLKDYVTCSKDIEASDSSLTYPIS